MANRSKILISGLPGSGKSYVSSLFPNVVELDHYGTHKPEGWIVKDFPMDRVFYSGTCSNLDDVIRVIKPVMIIFVEPTVDFLRKVTKMKLRDLSDDPAAIVTRKYFEAQVTKTNKQWAQQINRERKALEKFAPVWTLFNPGIANPQHGWHKD